MLSAGQRPNPNPGRLLGLLPAAALPPRELPELAIPAMGKWAGGVRAGGRGRSEGIEGGVAVADRREG